MWQKIKCWLGWHEWSGNNPCSIGGCEWHKRGNMCCWQSANGEMHWCEHQMKCKHCGKVKR